MFIPLTPVRFLHRAIDLFGHKTGVICGRRSFTYAEFGNRCQRLASALEKAGMKAGDRVAYLSYNTHQLLEGYFGVIQAKGVCMPLNVRLAAVELTEILNHSGASFLFYEPEFEPLTAQFRTECKQLRHFIQLNAEYEEFLSSGTPARAGILAFDENSVAELFYTSGSTGTPKGAMLTHRTLYLHGLSVAGLTVDPETITHLHTIPLFHANNWGHAHACTMLGAVQVMARRFDPAAVLDLIERHRVTDFCIVPAMANALLHSPKLPTTDTRSMRNIQIGGAASSPELIARMQEAFGCNVYAGYGLTETGPVLTTGRFKSTLSKESGPALLQRQSSAGWAVPGVEIRVVDDHGDDVPRDGTTIGEIISRGDHIMEGYYGDIEGTSAALRHGWFYTGDLAAWDLESFISIVDRKKEIIISGGENISSLEVEKAISAHPSVFECAVVAAPDDRWGEVPVGIVVLKPGAQLDGDELCTFLQGRLSRYKTPRRFEFTNDPLPKTGTGKIRKLALREKFWVGKERRVQG